MINEAIRIAVAEEMGWQYLTHDSTFNFLKPPKDDFGFCCGKHLSKQDAFLEFCKPNETGVELPDYPNSLDACVEFENSLDVDESLKYDRLLAEITDLFIWKALPCERCEAFLRLRNRWKD